MRARPARLAAPEWPVPCAAGMSAVLLSLYAHAIPPPAQPAAPPSPGPAPAALAPAPPANVPPAQPTTESAPLPSFFTVERGTTGALFADGSPLASAAELEPVARAAAAQGTFAGAVLFGDAGSGPALDAVADVLRRAGFTQLLDARRSAPRELSALARAERERARREPQRLIAAGVIEGEPAPAAPAGGAARERGPRIEMQSVGLYVAGPANQGAARKQLLALFERNFGAFRRCHADAPEHTEGASFGVDLLVPAEGGRAKVRQTRTRLTGNAFRACMQRAFEAIRFAPLPSARPEVVSYSVLFRPVKR